jgi:hypothetical protein
MPYRDDLAAIDARCDALEQELAAARKRAEELKALAGEVGRLTKELSAARALREGAHRARHSLPVLENLRIASPCSASWDRMTGDERVRFCGDCRKNVYNLSAMTRQQAEQLLRENEGGLCVRFYQRKDGTVMTTDCPVGVRKRRVRRIAITAAGVGAALAATTLIASSTRMGSPVPRVEIITGEVDSPLVYESRAPAPLLDDNQVLGGLGRWWPEHGSTTPEPAPEPKKKKHSAKRSDSERWVVMGGAQPARAPAAEKPREEQSNQNPIPGMVWDDSELK